MDAKKRTDPLVINKLCSKCIRSCRQAEAVLLLECPRYLPRPFKSEAYKFIQLDLFGNPAKKD
jgi:hypothetical protein